MIEEPKWLVRIWLFMSSYIPLWVILFVQNFDGIRGNYTAFFGLLILSSFVSLYLFLKQAKKKIRVQGNRRICDKYLFVEEYEDISHIYLEYLITYVLPIMTFIPEKSTLRSIVTFTVIMLVIFFLYDKANLIYANPTLGLLGYKIFKVRNMKSGKWVVLITRKDKISVTNKDNPEGICVSNLSGNIYLEVEEG